MPRTQLERNLGSRDDADRNIVAADAGPGCSLLLYAARGLKQGSPIDRLTGRLGWSHLAVDANEINRHTDDPVIIDHRVGVGMSRRPRTTPDYQDRAFARIELPEPLSTEVESAIKRLVGSRYRLRGALRHRGDGDLSGTVCSQVVFECLPPDVQTVIRHNMLPLGRVGRQLMRWNQGVITPNHFAAAFDLPHADDVSSDGIVITADVVQERLADVRPGILTRRQERPHGPSLAHRHDCRLLARVVSLQMTTDSDDLGSDWQFVFDVNGRGPNVIRSRTFSLRQPIINPRKIIFNEWIPHCHGHVPVNVTFHATQFQGINDRGATQSDPTWAVSCPGQAMHDLPVHVDGNHETATVVARVLFQSHHAPRDP